MKKILSLIVLMPLTVIWVGLQLTLSVSWSRNKSGWVDLTSWSLFNWIHPTVKSWGV